MKTRKIPVLTEKVKKDCAFYTEEKNNCNALNALYCSHEECSFYKKGKDSQEKAG